VIAVTLYGESLADLTDAVRALLQELDPVEAVPSAPGPAPRAAQRKPPLCPIHHGRPMKASQYGGFMCTAKLADGSFCSEVRDVT
jgi:hypothetical protein